MSRKPSKHSWGRTSFSASDASSFSTLQSVTSLSADVEQVFLPWAGGGRREGDRRAWQCSGAPDLVSHHRRRRPLRAISVTSLASQNSTEKGWEESSSLFIDKFHVGIITQSQRGRGGNDRGLRRI